MPGIGCRLERDPATGSYRITALTAGGPAARSCLISVNDVLLDIDGRSVQDLSDEQVRTRILGAAGTFTTLRLQRDHGSPFCVHLERFEPRSPDLERFEPRSPERETLDENLMKRISQSINLGFERRDPSRAFVDSAFRKYSSPQGLISKARFPLLLHELKLGSSDQSELDHDFDSMDTNHDGNIDLDELKAYVFKPTPLAKWIGSTAVIEVVADAIPVKDRYSPFTEMALMDDGVIDAISEGVKIGLKRMLSDSFAELRKCLDAQQRRDPVSAAAKYQVSRLGCGTSADFHNGLEGRIGPPHLEFHKAMEAEHCRKFGHNLMFETSNYKIRTCPSLEWKLITERAGKSEHEFTAILNLEFNMHPSSPFSKIGQGPGHHGREFPDIHVLLKSPTAIKAGLSLPEVMALVLYTGPMFQLYNMILRQRPVDDFQRFKGGNNLFATTIHVLVSAIQKLSRSVIVQDGTILYRGLGGILDLPEQFFSADARGGKGYAEWAFMSTTSDKNIAIQYSGVNDGKPAAIVLVVRTGAIDRGACIKEFSQYPQEVEYLWLPLSYIQPDGESFFQITGSGVVCMVPVRVIPNLKTLTIEELCEKKKSLHIAGFKHNLDELRFELEALAEQLDVAKRISSDSLNVGPESDPAIVLDRFISQIILDCSLVLKEHQGLPSEQFAKDEVFRQLVSEMLEAKVMGVSKLRLYVEDPRQNITIISKSLRRTFRERLALLNKRSDQPESALDLCKLKGLVVHSANEMCGANETKLIRAAADGMSYRDFTLMIKAGGDVNFSVDKTPLILAAENGHQDLLQILIESKANVNYVSKSSGETALAGAIRYDYGECVSVLLAGNADPNQPRADGVTPLWLAAVNDSRDSLERLLLGRADPNMRVVTMKEDTALKVATTNRHIACVEILTKFMAVKDT